MQLTGREREEVIAICKKKAQECSDRAGKIQFPDQQEYLRQTAKMWDEIAASVLGGGALDEILASAPGPLADAEPNRKHSQTSTTDESGAPGA